MARDGRGDRIRTYDLLVPNQALYQAKLHPEYHVRTGKEEPRTGRVNVSRTKKARNPGKTKPAVWGIGGLVGCPPEPMGERVKGKECSGRKGLRRNHFVAGKETAASAGAVGAVGAVSAEAAGAAATGAAGAAGRLERN
jgi:hypothetical protein